LHRPKYFKHKTILASIDRRVSAAAPGKIALPKRQAEIASRFCTGEFRFRARTHCGKLFRSAAKLAY
jgi:hypothetical protein